MNNIRRNRIGKLVRDLENRQVAIGRMLAEECEDSGAYERPDAREMLAKAREHVEKAVEALRSAAETGGRPVRAVRRRQA